MFAALHTIEPPILELGTARLLEGDKPLGMRTACLWSKIEGAKSLASLVVIPRLLR